MSIILLIGKKDDPHIKGIQKELTILKEKSLLIDEFTNSDSFNVRFDGCNTFATLCINGKKLSVKQIKSVWNSAPITISIQKKILEESKEFIDAEWAGGISSLWNATPSNWVNSPTAILSVHNRLKQLQIANSVGLKTPKTLITNDPKNFLLFYAECENNIIMKTLNGSRGLPDGKRIFTTRITKKELQGIDDLRVAPCMLQEYIPKKVEIRATIVGNTIHAVEIHSQNSAKTMHDWRHYDDFKKTPYFPHVLPRAISSKLLKFMKKTHLQFGAADLILTPNDEYIFLEINPNGRWWWIQELTGINIAKTIALFLAKKSSH